MRIKDEMKKKKIIVSVCLVFVLLVVWYLFSAGEILVREDEIEKSDGIVVLLGSIPDRILEAVDLYHEGYGDKIIMVETEKEGYEHLVEKNVEVPLQERTNELIAVKLGVPKEDIIILEGNTNSTQDEAVEVRDYLREKSDISSIILVTSSSHSFRASKIFEKAFTKLDHQVELISRPTKYDLFDSKNWYKEREQVEEVVFETLKLINFYLKEQFEM